jgi:hypothetical protein
VKPHKLAHELQPGDVLASGIDDDQGGEAVKGRTVDHIEKHGARVTIHFTDGEAKETAFFQFFELVKG